MHIAKLDGGSHARRVIHFGKGGIDDLLGGLWGGDTGSAKGGLEKIEALKDLFKIDIGEIEIKNTAWVTFPIIAGSPKK